jgi:DNA (cytosine-5)-methyltransferase 1
MNELGYNSYYQVLNSKNYGIPQNRERVFTLSIRQDIDNGTFTFPEPIELKLKLKDMLEEQVDDKYFLSDKMINFFFENDKKQRERENGFRFSPTERKHDSKKYYNKSGKSYGR